MRGDNTPAVFAVVYGNRHFNDALLELEDRLTELGFVPVAGVTANARHSILREYGAGRPDEDDRKDLAPNVCAVYTEKDYRCKGIAGHLLGMVVADMKFKGVTPIYLITDHTGFYERYGWEFLCMVQGDGEPDMSRMYIHR